MITKPKPGFLINPLHPLSRGLVGWWLFNEGGGTKVNDYSGNGNHGTLTNMEPQYDWIGSDRGNALDLDGSDDTVNIIDPSNGSLDFGLNSFSFNVRIKTTSNTFSTILNKGGAIGGLGAGYRLLLRTTGGYRADIGSTSGTDAALSTNDGSVINDNRWHLITIVIDRGNNTMARYVDGRRDGVLDDISGVGNLDNPGNLSFGSESNSSSFWAGAIDYVSVYNYAIPQILIQQLSTNPYANVISPLSSVNRVNGFLSSASVGNIGKLIRRRRRIHG